MDFYPSAGINTAQMPGPVNDITLFQCIPAFRPLPLTRLIRSLSCEILLDLEDSIQEVNDPAGTQKMKAAARQDCITIFKAFPERKFYLRINNNDNELKHDMQLVRNHAASIKGLFIPKTETPADIIKVIEKCDTILSLCIILETLAGIKNAVEILSEKYTAPIPFVFYGNYDFHLNAGIYPVEEQSSSAYWKRVTPLIKLVEHAEISFGNSPYAHIGDTESLRAAHKKLMNKCRLPFAMVSLHIDQTRFLEDLINGSSVAVPNKSISSSTELTSELFLRHKQRGRSFAFDHFRRLITPHEYQLMLKNSTF